MCRLEEQLGLFDQLSDRVRAGGWFGPSMSPKEILGEFSAGEPVKEDFCIEETATKFGDDLIRVIRDVDEPRLNQASAACNIAP